MPYFFLLPTEVKQILSKYFENKTVGAKLKAGQSITVTPSHNYVLKNSYIKLEKDIYALAKGKSAVIGRGTFGKVKYGRSLSTDNTFAIKIIPFISSDKILREIESEVVILYDLGLYHDTCSRNKIGINKKYIVMVHAGVDLDKYISAHPRLDEAARLDLAIKLCWLVHCLHQGISSRTFTPYVHRDLKPANVALDSAGVMRLIDVGLASKKLDIIPEDLAGTAVYLPNAMTFLRNKIVLRQLDILALKRMIYMPNRMLCLQGYKEDKTGRHFGLRTLLSPVLLRKLQLFEYFDTSVMDSKQQVMKAYQYNSDPIILASLLVLARYNLLNSYGAKVHNLILAHAVLGMYFANQDRSDIFIRSSIVIAMAAYVLYKIVPHYEELANQVRLMGLFISHGITNNLNGAINSKVLISLIKTSPQITSRAVALLWQNGFYDDVFFSWLYANEKLAKNIIKLVFDGDLLGVEKILASLEQVVETKAKPEVPRVTFPSIFHTPLLAPLGTKKFEELNESDKFRQQRFQFLFFVPPKAKEIVVPAISHQNTYD